MPDNQAYLLMLWNDEKTDELSKKKTNCQIHRNGAWAS